MLIFIRGHLADCVLVDSVGGCGPAQLHSAAALGVFAPSVCTVGLIEKQIGKSPGCAFTAKALTGWVRLSTLRIVRWVVRGIELVRAIDAAVMRCLALSVVY